MCECSTIYLIPETPFHVLISNFCYELQLLYYPKIRRGFKLVERPKWRESSWLSVISLEEMSWSQWYSSVCKGVCWVSAAMEFNSWNSRENARRELIPQGSPLTSAGPPGHVLHSRNVGTHKVRHKIYERACDFPHPDPLLTMPSTGQDARNSPSPCIRSGSLTSWYQRFGLTVGYLQQT